MKVAFFTLGCKVNQYETEAMEEMFKKRGYEVVSFEDEADIYIINTCTVTNLGDRKSRQFIRRAKKLNEDSIVAAVGCYSQIAPEEVEQIEGVDVIIGTTDKDRIVDLCEEAREKNKKINVVKNIKYHKEFDKLSIDTIESRTRAYMKIQDGCNQFCSYCIIPYARGPIRSRRLEDILVEAEKLAKASFKEIVLTGIHVASYGKDLKNVDLLDIIEEVSRIEGIERIRLSSIEPTFIDERFMEKVTDNKKFCDHFHLSLQSGSNGVLQRMNRKYTTEEYRNIVHMIRRYMPEAGITTDIIVGFPGETEEEFQETCNFVKDIGFSRIHVFKYSPRKGTPASKLENQVHGSIKNERSDRLIRIGNQVANRFMEGFIGKKMEVLFEEEKEGYFEGYTTNYLRVKAKTDEDVHGKILPVKIVTKEDDILIGQMQDF